MGQKVCHELMTNMHPQRLVSLKRCRAGHVTGHELTGANERQGFNIIASGISKTLWPPAKPFYLVPISIQN
jgi:hypothetical protein